MGLDELRCFFRASRRSPPHAVERERPCDRREEALRLEETADAPTRRRGDPKLVPVDMLMRFLDLAQSAQSGDEVAAAVALGGRILTLEPSNRMVNDHMPALQIRLKLQADEDDEDEEEDDDE